VSLPVKPVLTHLTDKDVEEVSNKCGIPKNVVYGLAVIVDKVVSTEFRRQRVHIRRCSYAKFRCQYCLGPIRRAFWCLYAKTC